MSNCTVQDPEQIRAYEQRIINLEIELARVTELLKGACGLLSDINQEYQFLTIKEFFKNPEIKEILK